MFGNDYTFQSILEMAGFSTVEAFSVFLTDTISPMKTNVRDTKDFVQTPLKKSYEMTYEAIQKDSRVGLMANHVSRDGRSTPISSKGFKALQGAIPSIAANRVIGKEDYLTYMKTIDSLVSSGVSLNEAARRVLVSILAYDEKEPAMLLEHANRVTYMRDQAVSTGGYVINEANNNGNITSVELSFGVPDANKTQLATTKRWWTDAERTTEGADADPIKDIDNMLNKIIKKGKNKASYEIEVSYATLHDLARHSKVRYAIGLASNPLMAEKGDQSVIALTMGMGDDKLIEALSARLGISFSVRSNVVGIEKLNKKTGQLEDVEINAFEDNVLVLRPKGNIGEIHSTRPLGVGNNTSEAYTAPALGGKVLITYTQDVRNRTQTWDSEEITLPVLTAGSSMYYLNVV